MCINPLAEAVPNREKSICFVVNNWKIPGGSVQKNEDYLEAIFRVVHQQTNVDPRKINFTYCCKIESTDQTDPILHVFHSALKVDNSLEIFSKKGNRLEWVDPNQIEYINLQKKYKEALQFIYISHFYREVNQRVAMKQPLVEGQLLHSRIIINLIGTVGSGCGL